eukprot:4989689-Pleurochrysis_carterae.AAC.2
MERGTVAIVVQLAPCHKQASQCGTRAAFRPPQVLHNPAGRGNRLFRLTPVRLGASHALSSRIGNCCQGAQGGSLAASSRKRFGQNRHRALRRNLVRKALPSARHCAFACTPISGAPGTCPQERLSDQLLSNSRWSRDWLFLRALLPPNPLGPPPLPAYAFSGHLLQKTQQTHSPSHAPSSVFRCASAVTARRRHFRRRAAGAAFPVLEPRAAERPFGRADCDDFVRHASLMRQALGDDARKQEVHVRGVGRVLLGRPSRRRFRSSCEITVVGVLAA